MPDTAEQAERWRTTVVACAEATQALKQLRTEAARLEDQVRSALADAAGVPLHDAGIADGCVKSAAKVHLFQISAVTIVCRFCGKSLMEVANES